MPGGALIIGEALVDLIETSDPDEGVVYRPRFGGSPLNVAVGTRRLGSRVLIATALGADSFGRQLRSFLEGEGVEVVTSKDVHHGTCLAVATRIDGNVDYEYFGDASAMLDIREVDIETVRAAAVVHAGSTAFLGGSVVSTVTAAFSVAGPFKTMDPNPRPRLIEDRLAYVSRLERMVPLVDLVKLSKEDADYLFPGVRLNGVTEHLLGLGASTVLVTRADQQTVVATPLGFGLVDVPYADAVDPTGAGDSFMASVISDIVAAGMPADIDAWKTLTWRANNAASITCSAVGGASSMPTREDVDERLSHGI
jgi:fructokinase